MEPAETGGAGEMGNFSYNEDVSGVSFSSAGDRSEQRFFGSLRS